MAVIFTGNDTNGFLVTTSGDTFITRASETVSNSADAFSFGTSNANEYILSGEVISSNDGIKSSAGSTSNSVIVNFGASVFGGSDGIEMTGNAHSVINNGSVVGNTDGGIQMVSPNAEVTNNGFVFGGFEGISLRDELGIIINNGVVNSNEFGILTLGASSRVINTGVVSSLNTGVSINGVGTLNNSGTITGQTIGVGLFANPGEQNFLTNSGTITITPTTSSADFSSGVRGDESNEIIDNSGVIQGGMDLREGEDQVANTGTITGNVDLGSDADTFVNGEGGSVSGIVQGKAGNDTLIGGTADDTLAGGNGTDELRGKRGDDSLVGGNSTDRILGGRGEDTLEGGEGSDTLHGGSGEDVIDGGIGQDTLTGGTGADIFVFTDVADSAIGSQRDVIRDFKTGIDKIDIDGISNDTFTFLGNSAFTAMGDAEVRVTTNGAGNSVVRIDADGDGTADSEINVLGTTGLDVGDFIL